VNCQGEIPAQLTKVGGLSFLCGMSFSCREKGTNFVPAPEMSPKQPVDRRVRIRIGDRRRDDFTGNRVISWGK